MIIDPKNGLNLMPKLPIAIWYIPVIMRLVINKTTMTPTMKENLREMIVTAINSYNPEYVDQCDESELISSLVESVTEFGKEQDEEWPDAKEEALQSFTRETRNQLSFNN